MTHIKLFDLHCDTVTEAYNRGIGVYAPDLASSFAKGEGLEAEIKTCAIFTPDEFRGQAAFDRFVSVARYLKEEVARGDKRIQITDFSQMGENLSGKYYMLSAESGACLAGKPENIPALASLGVRLLSLTWNGATELASGVLAGNGGLTEMGREAVGLLEENNIVLDVSHLNDKGLEDVCAIAKRPFAATHSNARAVCANKRNLTDGQFSEIRNRGGLVGINLHRPFLSDDPDAATIKSVLAHAEHFLALGGENTLCCGFDFDGTDMLPPELDDLDKTDRLYEAFIQGGIGERIAEKIFFENAFSFFKRYDILGIRGQDTGNR